MPQDVTDIRSNLNDQIANAAKIVGRSKHRQVVFEQIYKGKRITKTIAQLKTATGLSEVRILQVGSVLAGHHLVEKVRKGYKKYPFFSLHYRKVLTFARNPDRLKKLPTKISPHFASEKVHVIFPSNAAKAIHITIDHIDSFCKVRFVKDSTSAAKGSRLSEAQIKSAIKTIIGESGTCKDWGGEKNDLFTTKVRIKGMRRPAVFAFKGKATKEPLTLEKMGKRADQVIRLFSDSVAEVYLIVFQGQVAPIVLEQMKALAVAKALASQNVFFGIFDDDDLIRLQIAYPSAFRPRS
jgi:hypothetical protein